MTIVKSVPVSTKKPVKGDKAQAKSVKNGYKAQGDALASVVIGALQEQCEAEESAKAKLWPMVESLKKLTIEGHQEFRARLDAESEGFKAIRKAKGQAEAMGLTDLPETINGQGWGTYAVRLSQWRKISEVFSLGLLPENENLKITAFNKLYAWAVERKETHAAKAMLTKIKNDNGEEVEAIAATPAPTVRKGRPKTAFAEKAAKFIEGLDKKELIQLAALVSKALDNLPEDAPL